MEGVPEELNEIYLELVPEHLFIAVRSIRNAFALKLQPTNRLLSQPHGGCGAAIAHRLDLPVRVLSRRVWEDFPELRDQACDVSFICQF